MINGHTASKARILINILKVYIIFPSYSCCFITVGFRTPFPASVESA